MTNGPKKAPSRRPAGIDRPTEPPPFDADAYARESETAFEAAPESRHSTAPPPSAHDRLRDSCKDLRVAVKAHASSLRTATPTLGAVVVLLAAREDLEWFDLEPEARALVALVDGDMVLEEILAVSHTDIDRGLATFASLASQGIVAFRPG